ncbi:MAG: adenine phosphoribosyltransferase [Pseudomonadota bacterium]
MTQYFHDMLAPAIRTVPDWPIDGVQFRDITPVLQDPTRYRVLIDTFVHRYIGEQIDVVAGIDARGFILGAPVAYALNTAFTPIRKAGKLPADTLSESYSLEYGEATLELNRDAFAPGSRVLLVDDLIATGGTLGAAITLIHALQGELVEIAALAKIDALGGAQRLEEQGLRYFTLLDF